MRPALFPLLAILVFLSIGADDVFVGCGHGGGSSAGFACIHEGDDDPCDYIVTIQLTVLLAADNSPLEGATVTIGSDPPDATNTRITDSDGHAFWCDTSFVTGFSANCSGQSVGTVEPYDPDTSFSHDVLVSAPGYATLLTILTIDRETRDVELTVRMDI